MPLTAKPIERARDSLVAGNCTLEETFRRPPAAYGPVPFYWWAGEPLKRDRIAWQLDQLCAKGVRQTIISYPHHPDGSSNVGEPALFSREWWDLFRWFLDACRERGMTAGFQDYTLVEPILRAVGQMASGMEGGQMGCVSGMVSGVGNIRLAAESGSRVIGAWVYPVRSGLPDMTMGRGLDGELRDGILEWSSSEGEWFVALVFARLNAFDPLHPDAGALAIDQLYGPFERECPDHLGNTLNLFFQDELDFGARMPFWSNHLMEAFIVHKGYDLHPLLPALWHDTGPMTEKIRLDFADVVTQLMEDGYFKPVFRWHEQRGILFGHDNCGRGKIADGRAHYGDYFRTMRWFSAPGCDDPKLDGPRAFRGLKVNSSIAHLYRRPRVWVEAFHSSGWGTTPSDVVAAMNEDFAYGATVVNLHGLYYSTRGGWWEWAPPDFHFRQPYWRHGAALNDYFTRVCWLLSQGVHRCDVAILYPIASLDAAPADPLFSGVVAHTENASIDHGEESHPQPEETAFGLGKHLFDHACDFDFLDLESISKAEARHGKLMVADASYRVLVFPAMKTVRVAMLEKAREFCRAGGLVIAFGCLPRASDRAGREDAVLDEWVADLFGSPDDSKNQFKQHPGGGMGVFIRSGYAHVLDTISCVIVRDVTASVPLHVLHRHLEDREIYFISNSSDESISADISFREQGDMSRWNAWNGNITPLSCSRRLTLNLAPRESHILVSCQSIRNPDADDSNTDAGSTVQVLECSWKSQLHPVLDNRFGDFCLPAFDGMLGPQARRFRYQDEYADTSDWVLPEYDDSDWEETTFSFGKQLEVAGPLAPETDFQQLEQELLGGHDRLEWAPYVFSKKWGIERDPFLTDWLSGPHGLKGVVPDEYLDFQSDVVGSVWYLKAKVFANQGGIHTLVTGARCPYQIWLNGDLVSLQEFGLPPGLYEPWKIPHYECEKIETRVALAKGTNELLIKLVQPEGQRTRAFVAFDPAELETEELGLRWFAEGNLPRIGVPADSGRKAIRFRFLSPPGLREIIFVARGRVQVWVGGNLQTVAPVALMEEGCVRYRVIIAAQQRYSQIVAIRVESPADCHAGDALPEPVSLFCGEGNMLLGDWCGQGLATYSGAVEYQNKISISEGDVGRRMTLDLGSLSATAEVRVNGESVATLVTPPWRVELGSFLKLGENELSIVVANTLANHYSVGFPTPYAFEKQTPSGLFGPVTLIHD